MAAWPDNGNTDWNVKMKAFLSQFFNITNGEVKNEVLQEASTAPLEDRALANKKYVDEATLNPGTVKAWVKFTGATAAFTNNLNVSGIVWNSAGNYTVSWDTDFASDDYVINISSWKAQTTITSQAAGSVTFTTADSTGNPGDGTYVYISAIGPQ